MAKYYKRIEIETKKILILENNPRFTENPNVSYNFFEMINSIQNQKKSANDLLESEGDLSKLLNLIKNLKTKGFLETIDIPPILIKSNKQDDKYLVIEGNRRIFSLNLILKTNNLFNVFLSYKYKKTNLRNEEYIKEEKEFKKNKERIINLLNIEIKDDKIKNSLFKIPVFLYDLNNNYEEIKKEISSIIISRHSSNENLMRKEWSRTKNFYELKHKFISILNDKFKINRSEKIINLYNYVIENLSKEYQREEKFLIKDIREAFKVTRLIDEYDGYGKDTKKTNIKPSAIELSFSKIKYGLGKTETLSNYLNLNYDFFKLEQNLEDFFGYKINNINDLKLIIEENIITFEKETKWKELSDLIMYSFYNCVLNTRGMEYCKAEQNIKEEIIEKMIFIFKDKNKNDFNNLCKFDISSEDSEEKEYIDFFFKYFSNLNEKYKNSNELNKKEKNEIILSLKKELFFSKYNSYPNIENIRFRINFEDKIFPKYNSEFTKISNEIDKFNYFDCETENPDKLNIYNQLRCSLIFSTIKFFDDLKFILSKAKKHSDETIDSLFDLSILSRSSLETTLAYSSYYLYDKYNIEKLKNINPIKIFKYIKIDEDILREKNSPKITKHSPLIILDFNKKAVSKLAEWMREIGKLKNNSGNFEEEIIDGIDYIIDLYKIWFELKDFSNKFIHRYWSIPAKNFSNKTLQNSFSEISKFNQQLIEFILLNINIQINWIKFTDEKLKLIFES